MFLLFHVFIDPSADIEKNMIVYWIQLSPRLQQIAGCRVLDINLFLHLLQVLTAGETRVGWARPGCLPDQELGSDDQAFVFDGFKVAGMFLYSCSHATHPICSVLITESQNFFCLCLALYTILCRNGPFKYFFNIFKITVHKWGI